VAQPPHRVARRNRPDTAHRPLNRTRKKNRSPSHGFQRHPEEAAFRAEARVWLDKNAERLKPGETNSGMSERGGVEVVTAAKQWQGKKADAAGPASPGQGVRRPRRHGHSVGDLEQEESKYRTPRMSSPLVRDARPTIMAHGTDEQKQRYCADAARRGDLVPALQRAERRVGPRGLRTTAYATVTTGHQRTEDLDDGRHYSKWGMVLTRTDPNARSTRASLLHHRHGIAGHRDRPIKQINGGSPSTRSSSPTCAWRTRTASATSTRAGAAPSPR